MLSLIRIIDNLTVQVVGDAPPELPEGQIAVTLVVSLKAGNARGRHPVTVAVENPAGAKLPAQQVDVQFNAEDAGMNLVLPIRMNAMEGLFWFEIGIDERILTRTPFRIMYQRNSSPG